MWIIFFNKCIEIFSVLFPFFIVKCVLADVFVNWLINLLIKCILVYVLLKIISFIWRCYYCREELQIWAFARRLTKDFEQGGIFIVPHPLRHLIFYFIYYYFFFLLSLPKGYRLLQQTWSWEPRSLQGCLWRLDV